tara:strand:- start:1439 stop:3070 length:1632 start_codon:yes stop_codon:yes gene_type:complete
MIFFAVRDLINNMNYSLSCFTEVLKSILYVKLKYTKRIIIELYSIMSSLVQTTPVNFQGFQLLQTSPEGDSNLPTNYGTIDLKAIKQSALSLNQLLLGFSVDRSGSMEIVSKDGKTLLQHAQSVIINIARYLMDVHRENPDTSFAIKVIYFDNNLDEIPLFKINWNSWTDNLDQFIETLTNYHPRGSTNIQKPLEYFKEYGLFATTGNHYHILLTDGFPNDGYTSATDLQNSLPSCNNMFVGFGPDHAVDLLTSLSNSSNGDYNFVNSAENAGMLYGELLHGILYNVAGDITVKMKGGKLYNYKTKTWDNKLTFKKFATEHTQTLVFQSKWNSVEPHLFELHYTDYKGEKLSHYFSSNQSSIRYNPTNGECKESSRNKHVERHMYRVKTMEYLHTAKQYSCGEGNAPTTLIEELEKFETELDKFIKRNNYEDDLFMKNLQEDVRLCLKSLESVSRPAMRAFIQSRLSTHGRQAGFAVDIDNLLDEEDNNNFTGWGLRMRGTSMPSNAVASHILPPTRAPRQRSAYTTPSQSTVMRQCSQPASN